ncbi:MAG: hypothetical protein JNJ99_09645 [Crocinitomicaceae bacterium]|nr:hypothetical protein [Crocinitomicaceae bacterium]
MKSYYLKNGSRETGPFMLDDLKYQRISADTMVKIDQGEWTYLSDNADLKFLLELSGISADAKRSVQTDKSNKIHTAARAGNQQTLSSVKTRIIFIIAISVFIMAAGMAFAIFAAVK